MIITVDKLRKYVTTDITDEELEARLSALETAIRKYTNNHFIVRGTVQTGIIEGGTLRGVSFINGDTIEILHPSYEGELFIYDNGLSGLRFDVEAEVGLVRYPADIVMGIVNLMKWDISQREKIGIKSESISRWSVTYFDLESNSLLGYPASLLGFLKPYMRARF